MRRWNRTENWTQWMAGAVLIAAALVIAGCGKSKSTAGSDTDGARLVGPPSAVGGAMQLCNFKDGPADAPVKVQAFYPGRHPDTLAAVKALVKKYPGKVQIEIIDWRTEDGMKRRDAAGLSCAGVVINGKNAFELEVNGNKSKVLFVRGMDGEWTEADLEAAVKQTLASAGSGSKAKAE